MPLFNWFRRGGGPQSPDLSDLFEIKSPEERLHKLLERFKLERLHDALRTHARRARGFRLVEALPGRSRLGGRPDLPPEIEWPGRDGRALDFLLQIDLAEAKLNGIWEAIPPAGLLSFFYDIEDQPWGFDPKDLESSRVLFTPANVRTESRVLPEGSQALGAWGIDFFPMMTLPQGESTAYERFQEVVDMSEEEDDRYFDLIEALDGLQYGPDSETRHRLLGHPEPIQGDMQFEAELVRNGFYTGNSGAYDDPDALALKPGADHWRLLLQLATDEEAGLVWGDAGMVYFWIHEEDAKRGDFSRIWTGLQCG